MHFASFLMATAAALAGFAQAQNSSSTYPYTVAAGSVPIAMRISWCSEQRTSCSSICSNLVTTNNCQPTDLSYSCVCSDMSTPNITMYNNTVPFHECQTYVDQCVTNTDNATAQMACHAITCGGLDPARASASASSSSSSSSGGASMTSAASGARTSAAAATTSANAAAPLLTGMDATVGMVALIVSGGLLFGGLAL